jgi:hypothetical protein
VAIRSTRRERAEAGGEPRKATAARVPDLRAMVATVDPGRLIGTRDRAIIVIGFADDAVARLHRFAGGIPRALNNAATAALVAAAAEGKALVDDACAKAAVAELTWD